jgi:phospholipid transport system substrate-binding protein
MRSILTRRCLFALLCLPALLGRPAAAAEDGARAFMEGLARETVEVLETTEASSPDRLARLEAILEKGFDLPYLAQLAVGRSWRDLTEDERRRFIDLFTRWALATQSARLARYAGEAFTVEGSEPAGNGDSMVATRISGGKLEQPVRVDWRVREEGGAYRIIDVVIEGVSMVVTYRNEFQPIVEQGGVQALEEKLAAGGG